MNNVINAIIPRKQLPKYLIVVPDKDIIQEIEVESDNAVVILQDITRWMVRQIDTVIRRKRLDFLGSKPGAVSSFLTKTVYVRMLHRVYPDH